MSVASAVLHPFQASSMNNTFHNSTTSEPKRPQHPSAVAAVAAVAAAPVKREWRGTCRYKSGRCSNERTLKFNGEIHTMCEEHRIRHNNNQRRSDLKRRIKKSPELASFPFKDHHPSTPRRMLPPVVAMGSPTGSATSSTHSSCMYSPMALSADMRRSLTPNKSVKQELLDDFDMDVDEYQVRPAAATTAMEMTDQEISILHCILGMDTSSQESDVARC
ncbi:Aste57867_3125 [Aphanomyces stellatus]|uniref:Aste57867_3125 protein n=1 Tax=Aphanomyces stellatus TaxID=120398 RepID=A0A485K9Q3_9STRA|nr:hypothetical protein As57867_003116 [Aphanomyces stellatus]VFT80301.1 Aste57867_3125 [Aphanomyces stellatus]